MKQELKDKLLFRYTDTGSSISQTPEGDLESYFKGPSPYLTQGLQYSGVQTGESKTLILDLGYKYLILI